MGLNENAIKYLGRLKNHNLIHGGIALPAVLMAILDIVTVGQILLGNFPRVL
jgi:hypothetical protein